MPAALLLLAAQLTGIVVDAATGDPLPGATVVVTVGSTTAAEISDEDGAYAIDAPVVGPVTLVVYVGDAVVERAVTIPDDGGLVVVPAIRVAIADETACWFEAPPSPLERAGPALGLDLRAREILGAPSDTVADVLARARAAGAEARVDGALRLPGAPALSLALIDRAVVSTRTVPAAATLDVDPIGAGREAIARAAGGTDGAGLALATGGELGEDGGFALGADLRAPRGGRVTGQVLAGVEQRFAGGHDVRALAIATGAGWPGTPAGPVVDEPLAAARVAGEPRGVVDRWADLAWRRRGDRVALDAGVTAHALGPVTRVGGRAGARARVGDAHEVTASLEGGRSAAQRDARATLADAWRLTASTTLRLGVAADHRDGSTRLLPHATLAWDPTGEGRAAYAIDLSRRLEGDDLTGVGQHQLGDRAVVGGAWRRVVAGGAARDDVRGWLLWQLGAHTAAELAAGAPLDGVGAVDGRAALVHRRTVCIGELVGAIAADRAGAATTGAALLGWRNPHLGLDVTLEAHGGATRAARASLAYRW